MKKVIIVLAVVLAALLALLLVLTLSQPKDPGQTTDPQSSGQETVQGDAQGTETPEDDTPAPTGIELPEEPIDAEPGQETPQEPVQGTQAEGEDAGEDLDDNETPLVTLPQEEENNVPIELPDVDF